MARARAVFYTDGSPGCNPSLESAYGPIGEETVETKVPLESKTVEIEEAVEVEAEVVEVKETPKRSRAHK